MATYALLDELVARSASMARPCIVQQTVSALPSKYGKALADLLADPHAQTTEIRRRLIGAGIAIGETTIRRHRSGVCCCPKEAR